MDIKEFLKPYPAVRVSGLSDNADILDFFQKTAIRGKGLSIAYDRSPNFFSFLDLHSSDSLVLIYRDEENQIQGVATFVFRNGYVVGEIERVCYLGDLRIGHNRKASVLWRKIYGEFFKHRHEIDQFKNVKTFYTCLIDDNKMSERSLARNQKSGFAYHHVTPYSMINLMCRWKKITTNLTVHSSDNLTETLRFYSENEGQNLCDYEYAKEIPSRLQEWPSLSTNDFLTVKNGDEVIAAAALWAPTKVKRILLSQVPASLKIFFQVLRLLSRGKFHVKDELKVLYVTHLVFKRNLSAELKTQALKSLLHRFWEMKDAKGYHFIGFHDYHRDSLKKAADGFFVNEVKMAIYEVNGTHEPTPPSQERYGFEMALV